MDLNFYIKERNDNLNIFENLEQAIEKKLDKESNKKAYISNETKGEISQSELELAKKLDAIEAFTVERFEEDIVVLENRKTQEMMNLDKKDLPKKIKEGDIIKKINGKFFMDSLETKEIANIIKNKMDELWN